MIVRNRFRILYVHTLRQQFMRSFSEREKEFLQVIVKPDKIPASYWKKVLWVAKELKQNVSDNERKSLKLLETSHVTLLFAKPHGRFQLSFTLACDLLGARRTSYFDSNFQNHPSPSDSGKVLSRLTDMVITHGINHDVLLKLISQMKVPLFSASCNIHCMQKALSDLLTFHERLQRLKGLTLAWIGPPNSLLNSYLFLSSEFGMNVRYNCICGYGAGRMSPVLRFVDKGKENRPKEFKTAEETVMGAHIIATSMHPETKNKITFELLKNADPNWVFIHSLPRTPMEVSDEVFHHQKNLSFDTSENYVYVAMAIILISLKSYEPKLSMPCFGGDSEGQLPFS